MKNAPFIYLTLLAGTLSLLPLEASGGTNLNNGYTVQSVRQNYPRITLKLKNAPINRLAEQLQKACSYSLIYGQELLASNPRFSIEARDLPLDEVLEELFGNSPYAYSIDNRTVTLSKKQLNLARSYQLHGQVTDPTGEPVIGGTVMIKGTSTGVVTDADGKYAIQVKPGQTLVFNYLGMQPTEVTYQGAKRINLSMKYDQSMALDEVVVTGIFKKAKESYTGSVASVSQEDLKIYKGQNMLQTLKNIDASINFSINNLAGSNPNTLPQINIRGNSSLPTNVQEFNEGVKNSTNTPLILMDGFEISLTKLMDYNDDEIESINILKDASATAIYGSRGANGVIVVISKRPETGKLKVNLELGTNIQAPDLSSYRLLGAADKLQLELDAGLYDQPWNPITHEEYRKRYSMRLKKVLEGIDTDWLKKPVRTGVGQRYNLRLEGGNEEFRWGSSLSYNDIAGAMKGSSRRTFNGSITLMYNLKNLIFRNYTSVGFNNSEESKYGKFSTYARQQPYNAPYDEEGKLVRYFDSFYAGGTPLQNPLYDASLNTFDKSGYQEIINNFSIEWNILKELTLRGQLGISTTENTSDNFLPAEHSYFIENKEYATGEGFLRRGRYEYGRGRSTQYEGNLTLSYNKTFNDAHQLYVGLNYAVAQNRDYMHYFEAEGFSNEDMNDVMNATQYAKNGQPYGYDLLTRRISLTGNANYTFDNRYYIDLSYRMDGSSTFGSDKKYAPFWSSGIGWNLHNEKFLKDKTPFNSLRLKFSYGQTGSQQGSSTGASTVYQYLTNNKYMNWTGAVLQGLGNPDLTWQKTDQLNAGLEFGLWDNRFKGTFDLYKKTTSNLLSYMNLPLSIGFPSYLANIGEVKNNGWEASASVYVIRNTKKEINWIVSGQLLYNKNEISKLSDAIKKQNEEYMKQGSDISNLFFEGYPQNAIYAVQSLGIDPSTGEEVFVDKEGNLTNQWNAADKVFQGSLDPKYRGSLSTTFIWKDLTFNMSWGFRWGGKIYNSTLLDKVEVTTAEVRDGNVDERVLSQRWYKPGDVSFFNKLQGSKTRASSRYVMDDNVMELQSVGLQYRWHTEGLKKAIGASSVIFGLNLSDVFYFSSTKMERGTDYPFARTIQGSVKLSF